MKGCGVSLSSLPVGPWGSSWGLAHVSHGKSHRELSDTKAEPEGILCRSQWVPRGCSGHPRGLLPLELGSELLRGTAPHALHGCLTLLVPPQQTLSCRAGSGPSFMAFSPFLYHFLAQKPKGKGKNHRGAEHPMSASLHPSPPELRERFGSIISSPANPFCHQQCHGWRVAS